METTETAAAAGLTSHQAEGQAVTDWHAPLPPQLPTDVSIGFPPKGIGLLLSVSVSRSDIQENKF